MNKNDCDIYVWYNPHNKSYYYKINYNMYKHWSVSDVNQYDHKLVLIIPKQARYPVVIKYSLFLRLRKRLINWLIQFLEKIK